MKKFIKYAVIIICILCVIIGISGYLVYRNRDVIANKALNYAMQSLTESSKNEEQTWLGGLLNNDSAKDMTKKLLMAVLNDEPQSAAENSKNEKSESKNIRRRYGLATMAEMLVNGVTDGENADLGQMANAFFWPAGASGDAENINDINARDTKGRTLLMNVCRVDVTPKVIKMLLRYGADINAVDENGRNALMYAAALNEDPQVVQILLDNGADAEVKDVNGYTAYDHAKKDEIRALFKKPEKSGWFN